MFKYRNTKKNADQFVSRLQQRRGPRQVRGYCRIASYLGFIVFLFTTNPSFSQSKRVIKKHEIRDGISPKSVVSSGTGLFAAQNMMYRHSITIYNADGLRLAKINDAVDLNAFGLKEYKKGKYLGGPVEAAFTKDGKYLWVSNYNMVGEGFNNPGCDACNGNSYDPGFLYKISTATFEIENVVQVGSIPKFLSISDDQKTLIVSNWSSGDISIVDLNTEKEVKRISVGSHPRGVDITADSKTAFVTVMGSTKIAQIDLVSYEVSYLKDMGRSPRHLILSQHDSVMYVSMNSGNVVTKYNRFTKTKTNCKTPSGPRSMCISPDDQYLYVVNYFDNSFSKIRTMDMKQIEVIPTGNHPIGICGNWDKSEVWVACYSGKIEIFKDFHLDSLKSGKGIFDFDLSDFWAFNHNSPVIDNVSENSNTDTMGVVPIQNNQSEENSLVKSGICPKTEVQKIDKDRFNIYTNSTEDCHYYVIAGSFSVNENAEKRKNELIEKGFQAILLDGNLTYVSATCSSERSSAELSVKDVKEKTGYSAWILKR